MQKKKFKIGYTTGTFDLFHVGHLNILEKAKENCEYLVVGVSTDELVKEYKGEFPIIPFEDRLRIVKSLKCVDQITLLKIWINMKRGEGCILINIFMETIGKIRRCTMK